mgnify:FL=1
MAKKFKSKDILQENILKGVNTLADNVASTLGPRGRNVIIHEKGKNPIITKDGVTIASFVELDDAFQNAGAQIIKQAAAQTNADAGDGTTTATVIARAILNQAQKYLLAGSSPVEVKRGIDKSTKQIIKNLQDMSTPIKSEEDIRHIATISANGDKLIGNLIATAVDKVGKDGSITVKDGKSVDTSLDVSEGFRFDSGFLSPQFITDERKGSVSYDDPLILVTDYSIELVEDILPVLEVVARESKPLVIIAENVEGQALAALIMNAIRGTMKVAAVKAPRYGEERRNVLEDLAVAVGAEFISRSSGKTLKDTKLMSLGSAETIEIIKNFTVVVNGKGDYEKVEERVERIKDEVAQTEDRLEAERLQDRISRLASGVAIINVGGSTEIEMIERKHRIEDALEAVRSAQLEGIVPGGGVALLRASKDLYVDVENQDQDLGVKIILEAVKAPLRQMAENAGESADIIFNTVDNEEGNVGWDFASRSLVDMIQVGVIDPVKVTKAALQNASSAAGTLITTNYAIVES